MAQASFLDWRQTDAFKCQNRHDMQQVDGDLRLRVVRARTRYVQFWGSSTRGTKHAFCKKHCDSRARWFE